MKRRDGGVVVKFFACFSTTFNMKIFRTQNIDTVHKLIHYYILTK